MQNHFKAFFPHNSSNVSIYKWVKKYNLKIANFTDNLKINTGSYIEVDEMEYHRRKSHKKGSKGIDKNWFIDGIDVKTRFMINSTYVKHRSKNNLKKVLLNIRVPKLLVQPGGHYAALFWTDQPPKNAGIGVANRVGTIFLFRVKGQIKEELKIMSFEKEKDALAFDLQVENGGNTHLKPAGQILISNWQHQPVKTIFINPLGQLILPQSRRQFRLAEDSLGDWGKFYAQAKINYGADNQEAVSSEVVFWLVPANWQWQILGGLAITIFLIVLITSLIAETLGYGPK